MAWKKKKRSKGLPSLEKKRLTGKKKATERKREKKGTNDLSLCFTHRNGENGFRQKKRNKGKKRLRIPAESTPRACRSGGKEERGNKTLTCY